MTPAHAGGGSDDRAAATVERYEKQVHELQTQVKFLEDEVALLRRRLTNAPRQVTILEEKLIETRERPRAGDGPEPEARRRAARASRRRSRRSREEVEKLSQPPASFGVFLGANDDGSIDVFTSGRKMRVNASARARRSARSPGVAGHPQRGAERRRGPRARPQGEVVKVKDRLGEDRVVVFGRGDEEIVATLAGACVATAIRAGDVLLYRPPLRRGPRAAAEGGGRGARPGGDPRLSATRTSAASRGRSRRSATPSSCRSCTRSCSTSTSWSRRRASCCTALRAAARRSSRRRSPNSLADKVARADRPRGRALATSSTSRVRSCSTSTSARPSGRSARSSSARRSGARRACPSSCSSTRWTRSSARAAPGSPPTWSPRSCRSCCPSSTASRP